MRAGITANHPSAPTIAWSAGTGREHPSASFATAA